MILNPTIINSLPDAGRPYVDSCTYDEATKKVKVQARVAQAGEVKNPVGEVQEFTINVPDQVRGVVYEYMVFNHTEFALSVSADDPSAPGETYMNIDAYLEAYDPQQGAPNVATIYSKVKTFPEGIQFTLRELQPGIIGTANYEAPTLIVQDSLLFIQRMVNIHP